MRTEGIGHLKISQRPYRESNPEAPVLWRSRVIQLRHRPESELWFTYEQWRTEGVGFGVFKPPPKFRSFDKAAFDCKLSGKCLVFLFQHPN